MHRAVRSFYLSILTLVSFFLISGDVNVKTFEKFLHDPYNREIVLPVGFRAAERYLHDIYKTPLKLCSCVSCYNRCGRSIGYSGQNIDQFVLITMIQKFMKSLHDQEELNTILSACDLFDLNIAPNAKKYTARICNGDYVHIAFASPLSQVAYNHKEIDIAQLLLENGADINKPDLQGAFPLDYAIHTDNKKMINFLISNGGKCSLSRSIEKLQTTQIIPTVILPTSRLKYHAE